MRDLCRKTKAQSAMEYLMTYGWAILIMAVVLAALFALGVFNGSTATGTSCLVVPGYLCANPVLSPAGQLSFTFGQDTGQPIYNIQLACTSTENQITGTSGANLLPWQPIAYNGMAYQNLNAANAVNSLLILPSGQFQITNLNCYTTGGAGANTLPLGTQFTGYIWLNYSTNRCVAPPCSWLTARIGTVNVKIT